MKLSFKEKIYCSVMWGLRHIFDSNHGKEESKYKIDSDKELKLAFTISNMVCTCTSGWPKVDKFKVDSFVDALELCAAVCKYERTHGIKWLTSQDEVRINTWRQFTNSKHPDVSTSFFEELKHAILMEFL